MAVRNDGGGAELEFVATTDETNIEDRLALLGGHMAGERLDREVSLRLLRHLASSVRHQQFHDTEVVTGPRGTRFALTLFQPAGRPGRSPFQWQEAPRLTVAEIGLFERDVRLRMPFRFGGVTLTGCSRSSPGYASACRTAARIGGRRPSSWRRMWFDKTPGLSGP